MGRAIILKENYEPGKGHTAEWRHPMPELGEVVIRTDSAIWNLSVTDDGHLDVRVTNLPGRPQPRIVIKADSANVVVLETRRLGT